MSTGQKLVYGQISRLHRASKGSHSKNSEGEHLLLCSPTGSGKTLTAFLTIIDDLVRGALDGTLPDSVQCVYISPIKALANDIEKNLLGPLGEIKERFLPSRAKEIKVGLRTGDTPQSERRKCSENHHIY